MTGQLHLDGLFLAPGNREGTKFLLRVYVKPVTPSDTEINLGGFYLVPHRDGHSQAWISAPGSIEPVGRNMHFSNRDVDITRLLEGGQFLKIILHSRSHCSREI